MRAIWSKKTVPKWWLPLIGSTAAAAIVTTIVIIGESNDSRPPRGWQTPCEPLSEGSQTVHLAGTGVWLPLARAFEAAFEADHPEIDIVVHQSIGSRGGRSAVSDGRIDIGLSSSSSDVPRTLECCEVIEIARSAVVFAVNPTVRENSVTFSGVVEIFTGRRSQWSDGQTIVPLLREQGDSSTEIASVVIPDFRQAMSDARRHGRSPTYLTDAEMGHALEETPGAIGLYDLGALLFEGSRLRYLTLNGVEPNRETISDGSYPLSRGLVMYLRQDLHPEAQAFVDFVRSEAGRTVLQRGDVYLPLMDDEP